MVYRALFAKTGKRVHLDDALEAVDGALEEYRKATSAYDIGTAEQLRQQILTAKGKLQPGPQLTKNRATKK